MSLLPLWRADMDIQVPFMLRRFSSPSNSCHRLSLYSMRHYIRDMVDAGVQMSHVSNLPMVTSL